MSMNGKTGTTTPFAMNAPAEPTIDEARRAKLRAFLVDCRARLKPHEVGLPSTGRRRVCGLRREEIAELAGVSSDWYRWLESGRQIRVSVPFLANLARALRLTPIEQIKLFSLALPEIYQAFRAA
jgi:DNA-binding XRE family transcriptional regulator